VSFDQGLHETVEWYRGNEWWWRPIKEQDPNFKSYYQAQYEERR
jgi:dTDP-D-glucose 4,6-dehydratase